MFAVLVHQGWSLIVRIGVVIYCENILLKVVICYENLQAIASIGSKSFTKKAGS